MNVKNLIDNVINNITEPSENEISEKLKAQLNCAFVRCFNDLQLSEKMNLINDYLSENNYPIYYPNTKSDLIALLGNDTEQVYDFVKANYNSLYKSHLMIDGYGKIKTISQWEIESLYTSDNDFIVWCVDNEKIATYNEILDNEIKLLEMIKEEAKKQFVNCKFYLYEKEYNYICDRWNKDTSNEPEYIDGFVRFFDKWNGEKAHTNNGLFNGKWQDIKDNQIKKVQGCEHIANHLLKLPDLATLNPDIKELVKDSTIDQLNLHGIGSWGYVSNHCSGAGCDGELKGYYVRMLKDYVLLGFGDNGKLYDLRHEHAQEYNPLNASQSETTRAKIEKVFNWLWQQVREFNK